MNTAAFSFLSKLRWLSCYSVLCRITLNSEGVQCKQCCADAQHNCLSWECSIWITYSFFVTLSSLDKDIHKHTQSPWRPPKVSQTKDFSSCPTHTQQWSHCFVVVYTTVLLAGAANIAPHWLQPMWVSICVVSLQLTVPQVGLILFKYMHNFNCCTVWGHIKHGKTFLLATQCFLVQFSNKPCFLDCNLLWIIIFPKRVSVVFVSSYHADVCWSVDFSHQFGFKLFELPIEWSDVSWLTAGLCLRPGLHP